MAFEAPSRRSICAILHNINAEFESSNESSTNCSRTACRVPNLIRQLTLSLKMTYAEVSTAGFMRKGTSLTYPTNEHGHLILNKARPVLNKRFQLLDNIANGTFSQIFSAQCLYSQREVAVKLLRVGYDILGHRESALLKHFNRKCGHGPQYFAELLLSFDFDDHFTIVMKKYDTNLLALIDQGAFAIRSSQANAGDSMITRENNADTVLLSATSFPVRLIKPTPMATAMRRNRVNTEQSPSADPLHWKEHSKNGATSADNFVKSEISDFSGSSRTTIRFIDRRCIEKVRRMALHLVSALYILKHEGIIHADVKPENCFVSSDGLRDDGDQGLVKSPTGGLEPQSLDKLHRLQQRKAQFSQSLLESGRKLSLLEFPDDFKIRLGDFGNSIHVSEQQDYYEDFCIQSLPYRAPEVAIGLPFTPSIDMWSLGVLLVEIITGKPLFLVKSREELVHEISKKICPLSVIRFAGGKYSELLVTRPTDRLTRSTNGAGSSASTDQLKRLRRLISHALPEDQRLLFDSSMLHFLSSLLSVDPDHRISPIDALKHSFLSPLIAIPVCLFDNNTTLIDNARRKKQQCSTTALRHSSHSVPVPSVDSKASAGGTADDSQGKSSIDAHGPIRKEKRLREEDGTGRDALSITIDRFISQQWR